MKITSLLNGLVHFLGDPPAQDTCSAVRPSSSTPRVLSRRSLLQAAVVSAPIFNDHGRIRPPAPVPGIPLVRQDGASLTLDRLVAGHATAVQLMFTQCSTTCPIQAAIFQRVQKLLPDLGAQKIQLLSLSVDPQEDSPQALSAWLKQFEAGPQWIAAAPRATDGRLVQSFFGAAGSGYADHSTQVNIVDRAGRLVWRTNELPSAEEIAGVLRKV
jgi:protein SCO1/2